MTTNDDPLVFFDLEATGLIQNFTLPDIIQIAAVYKDDIFDRYILPQKAMTAGARSVTGLRVEGDALLHLGKPVTTHPLQKALADFLDWLKKIKTKEGGRAPILLAYNGFKFDVPVFRNSLKKTGMDKEAKECIKGFADGFQMAINNISKSEVGNFQLDSLLRKFVGRRLNAHNAIDDAKALQDVYEARLARTIKLSHYTIVY